MWRQFGRTEWRDIKSWKKKKDEIFKYERKWAWIKSKKKYWEYNDWRNEIAKALKQKKNKIKTNEQEIKKY